MEEEGKKINKKTLGDKLIVQVEEEKAGRILKAENRQEKAKYRQEKAGSSLENVKAGKRLDKVGNSLEGVKARSRMESDDEGQEIDERKIMIWLGMTNSPSRYLGQLLDDYGCKGVWDRLKAGELSESMSEEAYEKLRSTQSLEKINKLIEDAEKKGITILTRYDEGYPEVFNELGMYRPYAIYCEGDLSLLKEAGIAVVGSRKASQYGKVMTQRIAGELAGGGVVVVSGLATGIDAYAHAAALEVGGKTLAVLGSGIRRIYPSQNRSLSESILKGGGLIISEYGMDGQPHSHNFPFRNRLICCLSLAVIVAEADRGSGSLITAQRAKEQGRPLYAIPGNQMNSRSDGTNDLIIHKEATMLLSGDQIFEDLGLKRLKKSTIVLKLGEKEQKVYNNLSSEPKNFDRLVDELGMLPHELSAILMSLEIKNIIIRLPSNMYIKK